MNILGLALKDALPVKVRLLPTKAALHPTKDEADLTSAPDQIALTKFKGIGDSMSTHICRRLQFHDGLRVSQLTEAQQNKLTAFLSDPSSVPYTSTPVAAVKGINNGAPAVPTQQKFDPLKDLIIESDLRREVRANIAHHRNIGSLRGRRHAQGYPVRGQRTKTNAATAKRLNRIERTI